MVHSRCNAWLVGFIGLGAALLGCGEPSQGAGPGAHPDAAVAVDLGPGADLKPDGAGGLQVGGMLDFPASPGGRISGSVRASGGEEFLVLLHSADKTPFTAHTYTTSLPVASAPGGDASVGPASSPGSDPREGGAPPRSESPSAHPASMPGPGRGPCGFGRRLQTLLANAGRLHPPNASSNAAPPKVGDKRSFTIHPTGASAVTVTAEAARVAHGVVIWIDKTSTPSSDTAPALLDALVKQFGQTVIPRVRAFFGKESDVDQDGHVGILISSTLGTRELAFVSPCDLVATSKMPGCGAGSGNNAELIYMTAPGLLHAYYQKPEPLLETLAHEFQHVIYFHRKFVRNKLAGRKENYYLNEGLSHLAQDLVGYQQELVYLVKYGLRNVGLVSVPNLLSPVISSNLAQPAGGTMRGAGYLFMRYLYDQAGGDSLDSSGKVQDRGGMAWLRKYIDSPELGAANVTRTTGKSEAQLSLQFWTALALSNRGQGGGPLCADPRYNYLPTSKDPGSGRQRGCNLFARISASSSLSGPATQAFLKPDGKLFAGGAELLLLKAPAGSASLRFQVTTSAAARAMARLIRIK